MYSLIKHYPTLLNNFLSAHLRKSDLRQIPFPGYILSHILHHLRLSCRKESRRLFILIHHRKLPLTYCPIRRQPHSRRTCRPRMRHPAPNIHQRTRRNDEDLARELDHADAVEHEDALGDEVVAGGVHVDVAGQAERGVEGDEAELAGEAMGVAGRELVHGQIDLGEGLLDVGAGAVGDFAAAGEEDAEFICGSIRHYEFAQTPSMLWLRLVGITLDGVFVRLLHRPHSAVT